MSKYQSVKKGYRKLEVFNESHKLVLLVYKVTGGFPREEIYGLTSQLRRAVVSVAANIVEGQGRRTKKDFLRFLYMSNGSLIEVEYYLELALDLGYLESEDFDKADQQRKRVGILLNGLIKSLTL